MREESIPVNVLSYDLISFEFVFKKEKKAYELIKI